MNTASSFRTNSSLRSMPTYIDSE